MKIAVFVGSLQKTSFNKTLAQNIEKIAGERATFEYIDIAMPLFNQDLESDVPEIVERAKTAIREADGILIVTPEYNRGVPGVLKNAIDWVSRPYGSRMIAGKPVGIAGASPAPTGTAVAQADLRHIMAYMGGKVMSQPELYLGNAHAAFDESGEANEATRPFLEAYTDALIEWINREK